jgi:hypothetical protein
MKIMSDGEALILRLSVFVSFICMSILLFVKPTKNNPIQCLDNTIDTIIVNDTIYKTDTITFWKQTKPDTVYIIKNDTI